LPAGEDRLSAADYSDRALEPRPRRRQPADRTRFDVRGFLAGFALSWAFGVVLYLFIMAG
jgi:hypothetical protein